MKCPVTGAICTPKDLFKFQIIMGNHDGPIAEGPVTNSQTGQVQMCCGKCKDKVDFEGLIDDLTFVKIQHEYRKLGQPIPHKAHCRLETVKIGDVQ